MNEKVTPAGPRPSPAKMLSELSNANTLMWIGVALVIHVAIFGLTSVNYLSAAWGYRQTPQPAVEGAVPAAVPTAMPAAVSKPASQPATPPAPVPAAKPAETSDEAKMLEAHKDSPVVKSILDAAKPNELPKAPSHNALDLDSLDGK